MDSDQAENLGIAAIIILLAAAIIVDLISPIPLVGSAVGLAYWSAVNLFLWHKGYGLFNARRLGTSLTSLAIEVIPAIQALPAAILGTIVLILIIRIQNQTGIKLAIPGAKTPGVRLPDRPAPLNDGGTRQPSQNTDR